MQEIKVYDLTFESKVEEIVEGEVKSTDYIENKCSFISAQELADFIEEVYSRGGRIKYLITWNEKFYTEGEYDELHEKLENVWGFVDNIKEHLNELQSDMDNLEYDIDHAIDDCDSALDELEI